MWIDDAGMWRVSKGRWTLDDGDNLIDFWQDEDEEAGHDAYV